MFMCMCMYVSIGLALIEQIKKIGFVKRIILLTISFYFTYLLVSSGVIKINCVPECVTLWWRLDSYPVTH